MPIKIHIYNDCNAFYLYFYSLPIIKIDKRTNFNLLENKISIDNIYRADNNDLQLMKSVKINKIFIRINKENIYG